MCVGIKHSTFIVTIANAFSSLISRLSREYVVDICIYPIKLCKCIFVLLPPVANPDDECPGPCVENADCLGTEGNYTCVCASGYIH